MVGLFLPAKWLFGCSTSIVSSNQVSSYISLSSVKICCYPSASKGPQNAVIILAPDVQLLCHLGAMTVLTSASVPYLPARVRTSTGHQSGARSRSPACPPARACMHPCPPRRPARSPWTFSSQRRACAAGRERPACSTEGGRLRRGRLVESGGGACGRDHHDCRCQWAVSAI